MLTTPRSFPPAEISCRPPRAGGRPKGRPPTIALRFRFPPLSRPRLPARRSSAAAAPSRSTESSGAAAEEDQCTVRRPPPPCPRPPARRREKPKRAIYNPYSIGESAAAILHENAPATLRASCARLPPPSAPLPSPALPPSRPERSAAAQGGAVATVHVEEPSPAGGRASYPPQCSSRAEPRPDRRRALAASVQSRTLSPRRRRCVAPRVERTCAA